MKTPSSFTLAALFLVLPLACAAGPGSAPNAGDGVSDGSGFTDQQVLAGPRGAADGSSPGPAPNSGDGVSDGSGFDEDEPLVP